MRGEKPDDGPNHAALALAVDCLTSNIETILNSGGVLVGTSTGTPLTSVLNPTQLEAMAEQLLSALDNARPADAGLHVGYGADTHQASGALQRERWFWAVEVAARLPSLAARAGWSPVLADGVDASLLKPDDITQMAEWIHETYRETVKATGGATGSNVGELPWNELGGFHKMSNRASAAASSQRLAALRLSWRRSEAPADFKFGNGQVELLAEAEHRRWSHLQRRHGRLHHAMMKPWESPDGLDEDQRQFDRDPILAFTGQLGRLGLEIFDPKAMGMPDSVQVPEVVEAPAPIQEPKVTEQPSGLADHWYPFTRHGRVSARQLGETLEWTTETGDTMRGGVGDWVIDEAWTITDDEFRKSYAHVDDDT